MPPSVGAGTCKGPRARGAPTARRPPRTACRAPTSGGPDSAAPSLGAASPRSPGWPSSGSRTSSWRQARTGQGDELDQRDGAVGLSPSLRADGLNADRAPTPSQTRARMSASTVGATEPRGAPVHQPTLPQHGREDKGLGSGGPGPRRWAQTGGVRPASRAGMVEGAPHAGERGGTQDALDLGGGGPDRLLVGSGPRGAARPGRHRVGVDPGRRYEMGRLGRTGRAAGAHGAGRLLRADEDRGDGVAVQGVCRRGRVHGAGRAVDLQLGRRRPRRPPGELRGLDPGPGLRAVGGGAAPDRGRVGVRGP